MKMPRLLVFVLLLGCAAPAAEPPRLARDPKLPLDDAYTKKIREYTTEPFFSSPLVDYLPASRTVPTPEAALGDIAGAPGKLPYSADVHRYMRMLEKASPRVKVYSIGKSEEGREMIAVAVSSERNIAAAGENRSRLAQLADPRRIGMNDADADRLVAASVPVYYITGALHAPETGSPTALMELAYRLAVDESPYVKAIRDGLITLITPVLDVDGRARQVDVYNWHLAHPDDNWPPLIYWGKYVAHDNNRDAIGLSLSLSRSVLRTYLEWKAQVLHDLHESVPYLYDNTVGDGPYNAWVDPILTDEWQMIGWHNVAEMTKYGMPGVFTHGTFDTWSPGYLVFLAALHNGISRLYETFGNGGADTVERTVSAREYGRTWYRQNPPLPKAKWSQRNNNNYQQTALLVSLSHFAANRALFLHNFYLKSKRSIEKPATAGPAAYVFPSDDPRQGAQAALLRLLQMHGCEVSRATGSFALRVAKPQPSRPQVPAAQKAAREGKPEPAERRFEAGAYLVRMDQPYSRVADALLDHQYWSPNDPQKRPYDDTGWTLGELGNVRVLRVTDRRALEAPMQPVVGEVRAAGGVSGSGPVYLANHNTDLALMTLRYRLRDARFEAAEESFESGGKKFARGSFVISDAKRDDVERAAADLGLALFAVESPPAVPKHAISVPRIALLHTWLSTQDEGWWRLALDQIQVPYAYISTQTVSREENLRSKYDVLLFPPVGRGTQAIISGMPMWGNPLPWKTTSLTPNIGRIDSTEDMRPGLGWSGLRHLQSFVAEGGLLLSVMDTADLAIASGLAPGVSISKAERFKTAGSVLRSRFVDAASPIAYGYADALSVYCADGPIFSVSNTLAGARRSAPEERVTGRGTIDDPDVPQGRSAPEYPEEPKAEPWQAVPLRDEQLRNGIYVIPPKYRPRVILRYGDTRELLVSGLLDGGGEIAQHPAVIDVPVEKGHVVLFSPNPIWRGSTQGSYFLVFNAILNFDRLDAGRKLDPK